MIVQIRLFARAKDLAGTDVLTLDIPAGIAAAELRQRVATVCPALAGLLPRCALAVNNEFASDETVISGNAEIAVLPPVSGG